MRYYIFQRHCILRSTAKFMNGYKPFENFLVFVCKYKINLYVLALTKFTSVLLKKKKLNSTIAHQPFSGIVIWHLFEFNMDPQ